MYDYYYLCRINETNEKINHYIGHKKCREVWPTEPIRYEKFYNLFLDILLLILPLMMLAAAYTMISRTLWQSMDVEKEIVRQASGNVKILRPCRAAHNFGGSLVVTVRIEQVEHFLCDAKNKLRGIKF